MFMHALLNHLLRLNYAMHCFIHSFVHCHQIIPYALPCVSSGLTGTVMIDRLCKGYVYHFSKVLQLTASFFPDKDFGVNLSEETAIDSYLKKHKYWMKPQLNRL